MAINLNLDKKQPFRRIPGASQRGKDVSPPSDVSVERALGMSVRSAAEIAAEAEPSIGVSASDPMGVSASDPMGVSVSDPMGMPVSDPMGMLVSDPMGMSVSDPMGMSVSEKKKRKTTSNNGWYRPVEHPAQLSGLTRSVLLFFAANEVKGKVVYSKTRLAVELGTTYNTLKFSIRRLVSYGFIEEVPSQDKRWCHIAIVKKWIAEIRSLDMGISVSSE